MEQIKLEDIDLNEIDMNDDLIIPLDITDEKNEPNIEVTQEIKVVNENEQD